MKNRIFQSWGRNERGDDENVDRVLKRFFAGETPPEIRRSIGDGKPRFQTNPAETERTLEERHSLMPALVVGVAAAAVLVVSVWWRGERHEAAVDRKLADADVVVPAVAQEPVPPGPVEAQRPLQADLPFYSPVVHFTTSLSEGSASTGAVEAEWARVCLIDPSSATQLVLELPTELRIYREVTSRPQRDSTGEMRPNLAVTYLEKAPLAVARQAPGPREVPVMAPRPTIRERPYLGVFTAPPGPLSSAQPFVPLGGAGGLLILAVLPGSPAAATDVHAGEILIAFQDQPLTSVASFTAQIADCAPSQTVRLFVLGSEGYRTVETKVASRAVSASWDAPREWELPVGVTIHGKRRLMLTESGWPVGFSGRETDQPPAARGLLLRPAGEEYELIRLTIDDNHSAEELVERGGSRELLRLPASDRLRSQALEEKDAEDRPFCRMTWVSQENHPSLDFSIRWKTKEEQWAIFSGRFPMNDNPQKTLSWLVNEPIIQRVLEELPDAERRKLTRSLETVSFPAARRRIRGVQ